MAKSKKRKKKSTKKRNAIFIIVVIALVVVFAIIGGSKSGKGEDDHSLKSYMETEDIDRGDILEVVSAQGPLQPYETVHVRSEASGRADDIFFEVGDNLAKDAPLVELDQEILLIELRRASATVEAARANLDQQRKGWLPAEKANIEERIRSLEVDYEQAVIDLERAKEIHASGFWADVELERAQYTHNVATVALDNAKEQLKILLDGSPREVVAYYEANYKLAKTEYDRATNALGDATILCPMEGIVLQKFITEGTVVVSSQASLGGGNDLIALIGDISKMKIIAMVDETDIGLVEMGQKAEIELDAFEDESFGAEVIRINPLGSVTTTVTTFEVEMVIDNPDRKLKPNMTAYVDIITAEREEVVRIPASSVLRFGGKHYVFIVDANDELTQREVELGITDYEFYEVLSGVVEGERVVTRGVPSEPFDKEDDEDNEDDEDDSVEDEPTGESTQMEEPVEDVETDIDSAE